MRSFGNFVLAILLEAVATIICYIKNCLMQGTGFESNDAFA